MSFVSLAAWSLGAMAVAGGAVGGTVILLTSGPLADSTGPSAASETMTANTGPTAPAVTATANAGWLPDAVATATPDPSWQRIESLEPGLAVRVPEGFEVSTRAWSPFLDSDQQPPTEMHISNASTLMTTEPPVQHQPPPGVVTIYAVFVPDAVVDIEPPQPTLQSADVPVVGRDVLTLYETRWITDSNIPLVAGQVIVETERGRLLISATMGSLDPKLASVMAGILRSLEVLP